MLSLKGFASFFSLQMRAKPELAHRLQTSKMRSNSASGASVRKICFSADIRKYGRVGVCVYVGARIINPLKHVFLLVMNRFKC